MAFSLFSKPASKPKSSSSAKSPQDEEAVANSPKGAALPAAARSPGNNPTSNFFTKSNEWRPTRSAIEVAEAPTELCSALENAALYHGNGHSESARKTLADALLYDAEAKASLLAWLSLFDLLHRCGDKSAFEDLGLKFVHAFERSPPVWDERRASGTPMPGPTKSTIGSSSLRFAGELGPGSLSQIEALRETAAAAPKCRVDFSGVDAVQESACGSLAQLLRTLRHKSYPLQVQSTDVLRGLLEKQINPVERAQEGCWLLLLELMQWVDEQSAFDELAINYAVCFEVSPPSWEPVRTPLLQPKANPAGVPLAATGSGDVEVCAFQGILAGSAEPQIVKLAEFAKDRTTLRIDFSAVDRIDFVCAGALLNLLESVERRGKPIHVMGASAIVQALLLLIGLKPRYFTPGRH